MIPEQILSWLSGTNIQSALLALAGSLFVWWRNASQTEKNYRRSHRDELLSKIDNIIRDSQLLWGDSGENITPVQRQQLTIKLDDVGSMLDRFHKMYRLKKQLKAEGIRAYNAFTRQCTGGSFYDTDRQPLAHHSQEMRFFREFGNELKDHLLKF